MTQDTKQDDAKDTAFPLGRTLLMLARGRATGVLRVQADEGDAFISIVEGIPCAATLHPDRVARLGSILASQGSLDEIAYEAALRSGPPSTPVGEWLVASKSTSEGALMYALRSQLQLRISYLFGWHCPNLFFEPGVAYVGVLPVAEPLSGPDLVLHAIRGLESASIAGLWRPDPCGPVELTATGAVLAEALSLWPEERAVLSLLRSGLPPAESLQALRFAPRAVAFVRILNLLHAYRAMDESRAVYPILARKLGQLRRSVAPGELLEVPGGASAEELRRILRRWAKAFHPDRFEDAAEENVVKLASAEVMSALTEAGTSMGVR